MIKVNWQEFKKFVDERSLSIQYVEFEKSYELRAFDSVFELGHTMDKLPTDTTDLLDFENNYKNKANKKILPLSASGVKDSKYMRARIVGSHFDTITANQSKDIDWQIPNLQWAGASKQTYFDGVEYYAQNAEVGDTATFQVVDKDGIQYPAGTVLEEFASDTYIFPDIKETLRLYKAKLIPGMYIRIKYTSTGQNDVKFVCNLLRHLDESKDI